MFSGNRRFNGRQGEQIYNEEMYALYEILRHYFDAPVDSEAYMGPESGLERSGALWLDNRSGTPHLLVRDNNKIWKPFYDDWFKIIKDIRTGGDEPADPIEGQLWINEKGVLHWHNGSMFTPIKSKLADSTDFNANSFQNFLIIDPLKMTGGYIVENLSKIAQMAGGILEWQPNRLYQIGDLVYHTDHLGETKFYEISDIYKDSTGEPITSDLEFYELLKGGYLQAVDLKAQYLIPSETMDRIFLDGYYTGDDVYEKLSDVCIQISLSVYQGKAVAAVHVNPTALKNIKKKIIRIEKDETKYGEYSMIKVGPDNTEYYGFKDGFGQFLVKNEDYIVKANGIQLIGKALEMYDFVYCITYDFETRIKNEGVLYRGTIQLNNQTCIYIGQIDPADKLLVFVQGLCLEDYYWSYDCYDKSGLIRFNGYDKNGKVTDVPEDMVTPLFESKSDVAVMRFRKKTNTGVFTADMLENMTVDQNETQFEGTYLNNEGKIRYVASVPVPEDYVQPLIFVQGPNLNVTLGDYEIVDGKAVIRGANPGSAYYIVDAMRHDGFNMYGETGAISSDCCIPINDDSILTGESRPLVFVDGFYISTRDLDNADNDNLKIHGLTEGQTYTLLKDLDDENYQLLFDGEVSFTTIPMKEEIDDAVVYVGNSIIVDGGSCYTTSKRTDNAVSNEIRLILSDGVEDWYYFDAGSSEWTSIKDSEYKVMLDMTSSGYSVDTKTINILQNFGEMDCTYYAYVYADNIEKPLVKGYTSSCLDVDGELFYKLDFRHTYPTNVNALSVWMNGVKQVIKEHQIVDVDINGRERIVQGFIVPKPTDAFGNELAKYPTCYYVIERPESGEYRSCTQEILVEPVGINTYSTNDVIMAPGVLRVFIDGYRQPSNSYIVNNMNTITLIEPVLTDANNTVMVTTEDGMNKFISADSRSTVLVEVRQDYRLKEKTVRLTHENLGYVIQGATAVFDDSTVFDNNQSLPYDLFISKLTEINIYVNGAAYGKDFMKMKNQDTIVLSNVGIVQTLKAGDYITFEWR